MVSNFKRNIRYCYIPRLSLNKTSIVIGWFLVICAVVARAPYTAARDQCMTKLKMAWSLARAHVSLIDGGGSEITASLQYNTNTIQYNTIQYNTINFILRKWHINLKSFLWSIMEPTEANLRKRFSRLSEFVDWYTINSLHFDLSL